MKKVAGSFGVVLYILMGIVQWFAIIEGLEIWFGLKPLFAFFVSIFLTWIPIIGTIAGILGAAEGWGWDYIWAILLFTCPYVIYIILIFFMGAGNLFSKSEE